MKWLLVLVTGCVQFTNSGTDWQDVATITGVLATEQGPDPVPAPVPTTLRVATFNVHFADDVDGLAANIKASTYLSTADVLVVQEIRRYTSEPSSRAQRLAEALGMTWVYAPAHTVDNGGVHGLAILSRFPLQHAQMRQLPYVDETFFPEQRIALRADVVLGDQTISVVDVHLETRLAPSDRIRQLDPALDDAPDRVVIGGDFNTLPWTWVGGSVPLTASEAVLGQEQAKILDGFMEENGYARALESDTITSRSPVFEIRLDNVYAHSLAPIGGAIEHVDGSDHWPVWFDVTL
jgi:endonuclease/exonuclease/phosphatase family metal-dependent hydrolase